LSPDVAGIFLLRFCFFGGSSANPGPLGALGL
jgi:hypothetical protein